MPYIEKNGNKFNLDNSGKANIAIIASAYDATKTYNIGDYVIYNSLLYKCNTAISTAEDFDDTKWDQTTIMAAIKDLEERLGNYSFADIMTQAEYDQITPDEDTVYPIVG